MKNEFILQVVKGGYILISVLPDKSLDTEIFPSSSKLFKALKDKFENLDDIIHDWSPD